MNKLIEVDWRDVVSTKHHPSDSCAACKGTGDADRHMSTCVILPEGAWELSEKELSEIGYHKADEWNSVWRARREENKKL